jgi:hypothetical protein
MTSSEATMPDVTYAIIDEIEPIYEGLARRARAVLGVTAWGMRVTLPPNWGDYPNHNHDVTTGEAGQEEVYIPRILIPGHGALRTARGATRAQGSMMFMSSECSSEWTALL